MNANTNNKAHSDTDPAKKFDIQVYTREGRLVCARTLNQQKDRVTSLKAAERFARMKLMKGVFQPLILVVSEHTLTRFHQVHVSVNANP
jgi:hypothetical protein